jgi:acyl carrier protein
MTEQEVADRARAVLARRLKVDPSTIGAETPVAELGLDSLDLVTMAGEFEEVFSITIATRQIMEIRTFGDIVRQLTAKVAAPA